MGISLGALRRMGPNARNIVNKLITCLPTFFVADSDSVLFVRQTSSSCLCKGRRSTRHSELGSSHPLPETWRLKTKEKEKQH